MSRRSLSFPVPPSAINNGMLLTIPVTWDCIDCGFNTAPGFMNRAQLAVRAMFGRTAIQRLTSTSELYHIRPEVWRAAGMEPWGGCLCIGCLETRIERRLRPEDFPPEVGFNERGYPASRRLRNRRGY